MLARSDEPQSAGWQPHYQRAQEPFLSITMQVCAVPVRVFPDETQEKGTCSTYEVGTTSLPRRARVVPKNLTSLLWTPPPRSLHDVLEVRDIAVRNTNAPDLETGDWTKQPSLSFPRLQNGNPRQQLMAANRQTGKFCASTPHQSAFTAQLSASPHLCASAPPSPSRCPAGRPCLAEGC